MKDDCSVGVWGPAPDLLQLAGFELLGQSPRVDGLLTRNRVGTAPQIARYHQPRVDDHLTPYEQKMPKDPL